MIGQIGQLLFSIAIGYMGALEFFFIVHHLFHWSFEHQQRLSNFGNNDEDLLELQEQLKNSITKAKENEHHGLKAMQDGVLYKDGFRIDSYDQLNSNLKDENEKITKRNIIQSSTDGNENQGSLEIVENATNAISIKLESSLTDDDKTEIVEEAIIKKEINVPSSVLIKRTLDEEGIENEEIEETNYEKPKINQSVKTQFGQANNEQKHITLTPKRLQLSQSEESSSNEPFSSKQSSFSTQQSSSLDTTAIPELHFDEYERQEPDGQDFPPVQQQYSEEYLRSLDGIGKNRPLVRDDGSGRRRAFKKRRSSNESTSSRESRLSREEELKMFTSLEEEEFASIKRGEDYTQIKYSSDPNLKINKHHRRHKRSPVKDAIAGDESKSSLEMLGEEDSNPWGEIKPEHYKDTEFWKREKALSIEEELDEQTISTLSDKEKSRLLDDIIESSVKENKPKMLSFEDATHSEHEEAISTIKKQLSKDLESNVDNVMDKTDKNKNVSIENIHTVVSELNASLADKAFNTVSDPILELQGNLTEKNEYEQVNTNSNEQSPSTLTRSPRIEEIDLYQERWEEKERTKSSSPADISRKPTEKLTVTSLEIIPNDRESNSGLETSRAVNLVIERREMVIDNASLTPTIEVEYPSDDDSLHNEETFSPERIYEEDDFENKETLFEGISDFYDFNASVNPRRSRSNDRKSYSRSMSPNARNDVIPLSATLERDRSRSCSPCIYDEPRLEHRPPTPTRTRKTDVDISMISDFYDFNVNLNKKAYNTSFNKTDAHRDSVDLIAFDVHKICNNKNQNHDEINLKIEDNFDNTIPETPEYARTISYNIKEIEKIKEEMLSGGFVRSTYVGESQDFSDNLDQLRKDMHNFRRSLSIDRSPTKDEDLTEEKVRKLTKKELQDKILEEITKTTINFQDFSRDVNEMFLENERRGSDSALIQKPQILFQFEDDRKDVYDDDFVLNNLEAEEYHHFRRFSLYQESPVEEYPEDDHIVYVQEVEVRTTDGKQTWKGDEIFELDEEEVLNAIMNINDNDTEVSTISIENVEEHRFINENDEEFIIQEELNFNDEFENSDSNSEDGRQTVIEINDEIEDDLEYNNEKLDEGAIDEKQDENDWKDDEGAVGGVLDNEINHIYDDAIKDRRQSKIQRDYDGLVEIIINKSETEDLNLVKTETLLDEILNEQDEKFLWSPRRSRASSRESNRSTRSNLGENEHRYLGDAVSQSISSTRLRSRYGLGPAPDSAANFENLDNVDLNYKPKRQYNWRKNFKLDDDDNDAENNTSNFNTEHDKQVFTFSEHLDVYDDSDLRKLSLGGESITLYTRSPRNSECFDEFDDNFGYCRDSTDNEISIQCKEEEAQENLDLNDAILQQSENEPKKKKTKKKSRKDSKASILSNEEDSISRRESLIPFDIPEDFPPEINQDITKKKKKKKRAKLPVTEEINDSNLEFSDSKLYSNVIERNETSENKNLSTNLELQNKIETTDNDNISLNDLKFDSSSTSSKELKSDSSSPIYSNSDAKSQKETKLDKIDSSDVIDLIRDSGILGSSF